MFYLTGLECAADKHYRKRFSVPTKKKKNKMIINFYIDNNNYTLVINMPTVILISLN